jgi:hypothetical protein
MSIHLDYSAYIRGLLKSLGFRDGGTLTASKEKVFNAGPDRVICCPPFKPKFTRKGFSNPPQHIQDQFENHLRKQLEDLRKLPLETRGRIRIVFMAGGRMKLPDWYLNELEDLGIEVVFIDPAKLFDGGYTGYFTDILEEGGGKR